MSKTLMAAGRVRNKRERRGESIVVTLQITGEDARRFDAQRGDQCPRDFATELLAIGLEKIESANLVSTLKREIIDEVLM